MKKLIVCGACGKMGKTLLRLLKDDTRFQAVCGVDICADAAEIPVYRDFSSIKEEADCLVDFSSPAGFSERLLFAEKRRICAVVATTGLSERDFALMQERSKFIPIFYAPNFSPAVYLLRRLASVSANFLKGYDIQITERHHREKKDAPSGTALLLAEALRLPPSDIHCLRGGTMPGEHEILFAGKGETLLLSHRAEDKTVFARGALFAAEFLFGRPAGLYGMDDLYTKTVSE